MNIKFLRSIAFVTVFICSAFLSAAEPSKEDSALVSKLITAIETANYEAFVADGETPFRQLKKEQFEAMAAKIAPPFQAGYEILYLGDLNQKGYRVTLWKIRFKTGSDDALVTLSVKDGKVGGFFVR